MAWACCWECSLSQLAVESENAPLVYSARLPDAETQALRDIKRNGDGMKGHGQHSSGILRNPKGRGQGK